MFLVQKSCELENNGMLPLKKWKKKKSSKLMSFKNRAEINTIFFRQTKMAGINVTRSSSGRKYRISDRNLDPHTKIGALQMK